MKFEAFYFTLLNNIELFSFITLFEDEFAFFDSYDFEAINQLKLLKVI